MSENHVGRKPGVDGRVKVLGDVQYVATTFEQNEKLHEMWERTIGILIKTD